MLYRSLARTVETTLKKIGKYEITGILGRGGMGVVYRAEDKRIGRKVAIKTLTEGFSGQPEMLERFYREAQAGILQHPNIVIVYDLGDEEGMPFIVMEFVEGEPLDKLINSGRQLNLIDKLSIIEQVCSGLGYAHRRGVVHRDIKPANVIVQPDGHAKIVDFGIARVQSSSVEGGLTRTGNVIGTIHYIAPERLKGQPFDGRSDIFACGVMLYLLLTGQLPFSGEDMTVLQKLVNEPHPPLTNWLSNYPRQLDAIIEKALAKDPEQRYSTAEEFAADLHGLGEELKKGQITELFTDAERLAQEQQFGRAREVLLQLVRIDPQHTSARHLLGVVQQNLARMQRAEQIRQLVAEADEAVSATRFAEAVNSLDQAVRMDPENEELKAKLAGTKQKKERYDEVSTLMTQADSLGQRGDWTGAAQVVEKALQLDQTDTKVRALHAEYSRQAKIAAQQGQIRELLGKARLELNSRRFTSAIEILREVGKIDPSQAEMESLLQNAVSGQEQERRRKLLEQIQTEIENCLATEQFDRATELVERAVQQLPTETSLLQLKSRVGLQAKNFRVKQLISTTVARAQELFLESPGEALLVVQKALQELPGEERLLALEDSLRQRLKAAEKDEVRGRYLREAQDAMGRSQFDRAVEVLESYQLEFNDAAGVSELLDLARNELAQQQRRARIAAVVTKTRALMGEERFDEAMRLLEPAIAETGDASLSRLLEEARAQRAEAERKAGAVMARIVKLRERGQFDEAVEGLQALPASSVPGTQAYALLNEIRTEQSRKQATSKALIAATEAIERADFQKAIEALETVQRAYGESAELTRAIGEIEIRRKQLANEAVAKSIESARAAMVASNPQGAIQELKSVASQVEYAEQNLQADWRRLGAEAAKPVARKTGTVAQIDFGAGVEEAPKRSMMLPLVGGGVAVLVLAIVGFVVLKNKQTATTPQIQQQLQQQPLLPTPTTGTLLVKGNVEEIAVNVDKPNDTKGFTLPDGTTTLTLSPGPHQIFFSKAGYTECPQAAVTIKAGEQATVQCQMTKIPGVVVPPATDAFLTIHSLANAAVTIDNSPQGSIDATGNLLVHIPQVKPGSHHLQLSLNGYQNAGQDFTVKAGERKDFTIAMSPVVVVTHTPPTAILSPSSPTVEQGKSVTLTWSTANASEVSIDNVPVSANGEKSVSPEKDTTYVLTAKGDGGTLTKQVTIAVTAKVEAPPQPQPQPQPQPKPTVDEGALVQGAINNFNAALKTHDVGQMQAVGIKPGEARGWQSFFRSNPGATVVDTCPASALSISGDTANWSCTETTTIAPGGKPAAHPIRFTFVKKSGAWTIADRR
jgi:predicted Ser/Thr protein kinase